MGHREQQQLWSDAEYGAGSRDFVTSRDPLVRWVVRWRLEEAMRRLGRVPAARLTPRSRILVMCAGDALEGSILADLGFEDVTVSDISPVGVDQAVARDPRLSGVVLDAEQADLADGSFDLTVVQDGLHHLQNPVRGFTEMLRIGARAAVFLEPHDSVAGRVVGRQWEVNGPAVNYVFRWSRGLVEQVACSYLGRDRHDNLSFSFWHHKKGLRKLGTALGGGAVALRTLAAAKAAADTVAPRLGNQFCGLVVRR